jgi:hypothetical protein
VWHAIVDERTLRTACGFDMNADATELVSNDLATNVRYDLCGVCENELATTIPATTALGESQWRPGDRG